MIITKLQTHWQMCQYYRSQDEELRNLGGRYLTARFQTALFQPEKVPKVECKALAYANPNIPVKTVTR